MSTVPQVSKMSEKRAGGSQPLRLGTVNRLFRKQLCLTCCWQHGTQLVESIQSSTGRPLNPSCGGEQGGSTEREQQFKSLVSSATAALWGQCGRGCVGAADAGSDLCIRRLVWKCTALGSQAMAKEKKESWNGSGLSCWGLR